jgi:nicotinamidase-related amidase
LGELPIEYVQIDEMETEAIQELTCKEQFHIVIRKDSLDVFLNRNTDKLLELIAPKKVVVFGVALDFCVYYVVRGLSRFPTIKICLLKDVVKGLGVRPEHEILGELKQIGVEVTELSVLKRDLQCG